MKAPLAILNSNSEAHFKQMAVIILKKSLRKHFSTLQENDALILRATMLKIYFECSLMPVKSVLASLIAQIADYYFEEEKVWEELLQEISLRSNENTSVDQLRDALVLLRNLLDGNEDDLQASFPQLIAFLQTVLNHSNVEMVVEALKSLSFIVGSLNTDELSKQYGYLLQSILAVALS